MSSLSVLLALEGLTFWGYPDSCKRTTTTTTQLKKSLNCVLVVRPSTHPPSRRPSTWCLEAPALDAGEGTQNAFMSGVKKRKKAPLVCLGGVPAAAERPNRWPNNNQKRGGREKKERKSPISQETRDETCLGAWHSTATAACLPVFLFSDVFFPVAPVTHYKPINHCDNKSCDICHAGF